MKKSGFWKQSSFLLLALIFTVFLSLAQFGAPVQAASAKATYKKGYQAFLKGNIKRSKKYFRRLSKKANEKKTIRKLTKQMKKAYLKIARKKLKGKSYGAYMLTDIDKDGIPELIITPYNDTNGTKYYVYTFRKKKAVYCGWVYGSYCAGLHAYPIGNGVLWYQGRMGGQTLQVISLRNGKVRGEDFHSLSVSGGVNKYIPIPYQLDTHWISRGKYDFSPLK